MPVLGICRGMQVLNVAFGGTLLQHLPETFGHEDHRRVPGNFDEAITTSAWRRLAGGAGGRRPAAHDQVTPSSGRDEIGDGLVVTGSSPLDDLPEAIELPDHRFVLGVQWHPEADQDKPGDRRSRAGGGPVPLRPRRDRLATAGAPHQRTARGSV